MFKSGEMYSLLHRDVTVSQGTRDDEWLDALHRMLVTCIIRTDRTEILARFE